MAYRLTCGMTVRPERKVWAKSGMSKHGQAPIPQRKQPSYMRGQRLVNYGMLAAKAATTHSHSPNRFLVVSFILYVSAKIETFCVLVKAATTAHECTSIFKGCEPYVNISPNLVIC